MLSPTAFTVKRSHAALDGGCNCPLLKKESIRIVGVGGHARTRASRLKAASWNSNSVDIGNNETVRIPQSHSLAQTERTSVLEELSDLQPNGKHAYRFWQRGGGYDRNLRSVRDVHEKIAYVHNNPVRRGLVDLTLNWKWSSAAAWANGVPNPISIDKNSVPTLTLLDDQTGSDSIR